MISENLGQVVAELIASLGIGVVLLVCLLCLALIIGIIVGRIKLFKKCGQAGWKAIIPFYTDYVFYKEICGLHWAWATASIILSLLSSEAIVLGSLSADICSIIKILVSAMGFYNLAIKCHKDKIASMIFGGLFSGITGMVYGFSKNTVYYKDEPVKESGLF